MSRSEAGEEDAVDILIGTRNQGETKTRIKVRNLLFTLFKWHNLHYTMPLSGFETLTPTLDNK